MVMIPCPECGQILNVPEQYLDNSGKCKHCGGHIILRRPFYVAAIDFETTGLESEEDEVLEAAGVLFDLISGHVVGRFSELICPSVPISKRASEVNGITRKMVENCRPPQSVLSDFITWLGRAQIIVAHNAPFEAGFILSGARRHNLRLPSAPFVDTLAWSRDVLVNAPDHKLATLMALIGANTVGLHRAAADSEGLRQLTSRLLLGAKDSKRELTRRAEDIHACKARRNTRDKPSIAIDYDARSIAKLLWTALAEVVTLIFSKPRTWRDDPMTQRQREYLFILGAEEYQILNFTKGQASDLISELKGEPVSRQDHPVGRGYNKRQKNNYGCYVVLLSPLWIPACVYIMDGSPHSSSNYSIEQPTMDPAQSYKANTIVYVSQGESIYHRESCNRKDGPRENMTIATAESNGFRPCGRCLPEIP